MAIDKKEKKDKTEHIFQGKIRGKISFDDLEFCEVHTKIVQPISKEGKTGRIYLPPELINKMVYILVKK